MHATTEQLLTLRDGLPENAEVKLHVDGCAVCQENLQSLLVARQQLNVLSEMKIDSDIALEKTWQQVAETAEQQAKQSVKKKKQWFGGLSVAASLIFTLLMTNANVFKQPKEDAVNGNDQPALASNNQEYIRPVNQELDLETALIQRNLFLEQALRELPQPRRIMRGGTAATIASLEDQIALVDYGLTYAEQVGGNDSGSISLLQNRVDLMASLYQVRYSQALASYAY